MYLHPQKRSMFFYVIANRVLVTAATRHVSACHCEERGGRPATRQSVLLAAVQNKKQHLRRIRSGDEFALSAADFFPPLQGRGLPRQCAPWLAMTCRRRWRFCGCKAVRREGCAERRTYVRVQGRPPIVIARSVVASADTQQVLACHCEERSDVAIRISCGSTSETQLFPANTEKLRICPRDCQFAREALNKQLSFCS